MAPRDMLGRFARFGIAGAALGVALAAAPARAEEPLPPDPPALNLFGMTGLIDTPTAEMQPDAQFSVTSSYFGGYLRNTIAVQALPWLEAAFRYSALDNMLTGPQTTTLYDRSFDLKLRLIQESPQWPAVAIGLQDFLGTGVYSGEYLVGTKRFFDGDLKVTTGMGWGRFAGVNAIDNPFCFNGNTFCDRTPSVGTGGSVDIGQFFSGQQMGFFGGLEWQTPVDELVLKAEYSDDDYARERELGSFAPRWPLNLGLEYRPFQGIELGAYYMYGSEIGVRLSLSGNPFQPLAEVDGLSAPQPLAGRPAPAPTAAKGLFGEVRDLLDGGPTTTSFSGSGLADVTVETREGGLRWATATLAAGDEHCPAEAAKAIDAEYGVVDAVTFRTKGGGPVCTVTLRPGAQAAVRRALQAATPYPTDWYDDPARRAKPAQALAEMLTGEGLTLFGIELAPTRVTVYLENQRYHETPRAIGRTARALTQTMPPSVALFEIVPVEGGLPVVSVMLDRAALEQQVERPDAARAAWLSARVDDAAPVAWAETDGTPELFPRYSWAINPTVPMNLFDPDQPLRLDLSLVAEGGIEFWPGLSVNAAAQKRLVGNLDKIEPLNDSVLPRVRSDVARYLRDGDPSIARLTADYVTKLDDSIYGRVSAGLLERMYGGISAELLWKPANQSWGVGGEVNWVRQRGFDQLFDFRDYDIVTGHASLYWNTGWQGVSAEIDAGRYLAGDWGGTFTLKRRFANGWEVGGFFTLTDVPFSEFGEGSFDKGLFIKIPFNWFLPYESRSEFTGLIRPLTRDGGQRLVVSNRLYPMVEDMDRGALKAEWGGFWE